MACYVLDVKLLSEPIMAHYWLDAQKQFTVKFESHATNVVPDNFYETESNNPRYGLKSYSANDMYFYRIIWNWLTLLTKCSP